jgi:hypothetical protein
VFTTISNHADQAVARLLSQYQGKPGFAGLVRALVGPIQDIEAALVQMNTLRGLNTASGANLDGIGKIVGVARFPGEGDEPYRVRIKAKIIINISEGEPESVIAEYQLLTGAQQIILDENHPAAMNIESEIQFADQALVNQIIGFLMEVAPCAVRVEGLISFDPTEAFAVDGGLAGLGFGGLAAPVAGGKLATIHRPLQEFALDGPDSSGAGFGTIHDPLVGGGFVSL